MHLSVGKGDLVFMKSYNWSTLTPCIMGKIGQKRNNHTLDKVEMNGNSLKSNFLSSSFHKLQAFGVIQYNTLLDFIALLNYRF